MFTWFKDILNGKHKNTFKICNSYVYFSTHKHLDLIRLDTQIKIKFVLINFDILENMSDVFYILI